MSLLGKLSRQVLSVLDFGEEVVSTLIVDQKGGSWRRLGLGDAPASGVFRGRVEHIGDAVESIVMSMRSAEESAGIRIEKLYYNFFDPDLESISSHGSKILRGEGQIRDSDLREVQRLAERAVGHFEKNIVYAREMGYTIDDRDFVTNPLGIFGRKIDVEMRILLARAARCELWQRTFDRAQVPCAVPVLSSWSAAYGMLPPKDRARYRLIVAGGRDDLNIFIFGNNMIHDCRVLSFEPGETSEERQARALRELHRWVSASPVPFEQILLAGRPFWSSKTLSELREFSGQQVADAGPIALAGLEELDRSNLVGLLLVAHELERKSPSLYREGGILSGVKNGAASFFKDYF